jgi:hypothetical protein
MHLGCTNGVRNIKLRRRTVLKTRPLRKQVFMSDSIYTGWNCDFIIWGNRGTVRAQKFPRTSLAQLSFQARSKDQCRGHVWKLFISRFHAFETIQNNYSPGDSELLKIFLFFIGKNVYKSEQSVPLYAIGRDGKYLFRSLNICWRMRANAIMKRKGCAVTGKCSSSLLHLR